MTEALMKAVIYEGPGDIQVKDYPQPDPPGDGEILVKVHACGVCGSDVTEWYMNPRAPVVLGHEPAGEVVAVGAGVTDFQVGDRVALHHHMPCLVCDFCRRGAYTNCPQFKQTRLYPAGMAEYVRVPREIVKGDVLKLPDDMPYEVGALIEPVACCVRALDRCDIQQGDTVAVIGAGFNGILMSLMAPHWGADKVALFELNPKRIKKAEELGINVIRSDAPDLDEQVRAWAGDTAPHVVIVTPSKVPVIEFGYQMIAPGGTLMLYGVPSPDEKWALDINRLFFKEITVRGTYSASPYDTRRTLSLLANNVLDVNLLISHRFPIERADEAWHLTKAADDSLKVIVEISSS